MEDKKMEYTDSCKFCGERGEDVEIVINPYALEINGVEEEIIVCELCLQSIIDSI